MGEIRIETIGVIGAGQMGSGIAHVAALAGYRVKLSDIDPAVLATSLEKIDQNMGRQVKRQLIAEGDRQQALKRIATGTDYARRPPRRKRSSARS